MRDPVELLEPPNCTLCVSLWNNGINSFLCESLWLMVQAAAILARCYNREPRRAEGAGRAPWGGPTARQLGGAPPDPLERLQVSLVGRVYHYIGIY